MKEHEKLLRDAAEEVLRLNRRIELLEAKLSGVEIMATAVASRQPDQCGQPMAECISSRILRYLDECCHCGAEG